MVQLLQVGSALIGSYPPHALVSEGWFPGSRIVHAPLSSIVLWEPTGAGENTEGSTKGHGIYCCGGSGGGGRPRTNPIIRSGANCSQMNWIQDQAW